MARWALLLRHELQQYRDLIPEDKDCQNKWEAAMDDPEKYVSLLVGQKNDDDSGQNQMRRTGTILLTGNGPRRIIFLRIMR